MEEGARGRMKGRSANSATGMGVSSWAAPGPISSMSSVTRCSASKVTLLLTSARMATSIFCPAIMSASASGESSMTVKVSSGWARARISSNCGDRSGASLRGMPKVTDSGSPRPWVLTATSANST